MFVLGEEIEMKIGLHALIVDDVDYMREMIKSMLYNIGISNTSQSSDGRDALHLIRTMHFDIVLLDLIMPDMDGLEVLKEIRADEKIANTKIILITAAADCKTIMAARSKETRVDAVIVKPFSILTLRKKISQLL
ncbi:Response regulator receiver protein [Azospirillaceae bacterium]